MRRPSKNTILNLLCAAVILAVIGMFALMFRGCARQNKEARHKRACQEELRGEFCRAEGHLRLNPGPEADGTFQCVAKDHTPSVPYAVGAVAPKDMKRCMELKR